MYFTSNKIKINYLSWYDLCFVFLCLNKNGMKALIYLVLVSGVIVLSSCKNDSKNSFENDVLTLLSQQDDLALFGKVNYAEILGKAEYQSIPKFGVVISSVIAEFERQMEMSTPIYFSISGPFDYSGQPTSTNVYLEVKNADSLVSFLMTKGYDFDEKDGFSYTKIDDVSIGVHGNMAILVLASNNRAEISQLFKSKFESVGRGEVNSNYGNILASEGDILIGYDLEKAYQTSETSLEDLDENTKSEVLEMVKDSYGQLAVHFEKGELRITNMNFFSDKLKESYFFKKDEHKSVLKSLGQGEARIGLSINLDIEKVQQFLDKYAPNLIKQVGEEVGGPFQMAMVMSGANGLSSLITGQLGVVVFGEPSEYGSIEPSFNAYLGLGKQGFSLAEMAKSFVEQGGMKLTIDKQGVSCYSSSKYAPNGGKLKLPEDCNAFGENSISGFMNFKDLDLASFQLEGGTKLIELVESVNFDWNVEGGEIKVKLKNKNQNILKQVVDFELKEFESQLQNLPF